MKATSYRRPIGYMQTIGGQRCMLIGYTLGENPLPRYRRPDGKAFVKYPPAKKVRKRGPEMWARVKVKIPQVSVEGVVIKREPLTVRVTDKRSELYGKVFEGPKYVLSKGDSK